ncbi:hypothetical protein AB0F52_46075 [Amycolatopsis sp. NPDC024027]|uniref:hypothetical protein n=1 Tax=Amycolatopsis sp. NPDC024027 TaxID=3154327 RepID=UPI0033E19E6A
MSARAKQNPFHVLRLPREATAAEVGRRENDLCLRGEDGQLLRWAREELTVHPAVRRVHELLEVPGTDYRDEQGRKFGRPDRPRPVDLAALAAGSPPLRASDFDLGAVVGLLLDELLSPPVADLRPAAAPPVPPTDGPPPMEVHDVVFG